MASADENEVSLEEKTSFMILIFLFSPVVFKLSVPFFVKFYVHFKSYLVCFFLLCVFAILDVQTFSCNGAIFLCSLLSPRKSPTPRWTSCLWWPTCHSSPRPSWSPVLPSGPASTQTVSGPMGRVWSPRATRWEPQPASPWKPSAPAREPWRWPCWTPKERRKL